MSSNAYDRRQRAWNITRTLDFENFAAEGDRFISKVAEELRCSINSAARVTRAILHALRDCMPPNDAIEFAQGLPMALRGIFIEQYDMSQTPVVIRNQYDFITCVYGKNPSFDLVDFPGEDSVERAIRGVFRALEAHMDTAKITRLKNVVGKDIVALLEQPVGFFNATGKQQAGDKATNKRTERISHRSVEKKTRTALKNLTGYHKEI